MADTKISALTDGVALAATDRIPLARSPFGSGDNAYISGSALIASGTARERLTADRTYYVRTDGSDSNTGLANTAGGAFLTIQKAVETAALIDYGSDVQVATAETYRTTINVADGTYTENVILPQLVGGQTIDSIIHGLVTIVGNTTTPANCVVAGGTEECFFINGGWGWGINGFKLTASGSGGYGVFVSEGATCRIRNMRMSVSNIGIQGLDNSQIWASGTITYDTSCVAAIKLAYGSRFIHFADLVISGTPAFSTAFVWAEDLSHFIFWFTGVITNAASATGKRFQLSRGSAITGFFPGSDPIALPGSTMGTMDTGSHFNGLFGDIRQKLTANTTFYVRTTGNDTTGDGSSGAPWLTIQKAFVYIIENLDVGDNDFTLTVDVGAGTFAGCYLYNVVGGGVVNVVGAGSGSTTVTNTGAVVGQGCFSVAGARLNIDALTCKGETGWYCIRADTGGSFGNGTDTKFNCTGGDDVIQALQGGDVSTDSLEVTASSAGAFAYSHNAIIQINGTVTFTGTPAFGAFSKSVLDAQRGGVIITNNNWSGAATGRRFMVHENGTILDTGGLTDIPGSTAGSGSTGGAYAISVSSTKTGYSFFTSQVVVPRLFSALPTAVTGAVACISDSPTTTWGANVTVGGGGSTVLIFYNGTNWTVMGK